MVVFSKLVPAFSSLAGKQTAKAFQSFPQHLVKIKTNTQYGVTTCNRIPGATKVIIGQQQQRTFSSALFNTTNNNTPPSSSPSEPLDELKQPVLPDDGVNDSKVITLYVVEFKKWSKEQTTYVLCAPEEKGGAGLTTDDVKPLYDAGFKGNVLGNIVDGIKMEGVKYAIDQLERIYNKSGVPELSNTCQTVVFWVNSRLVTKLCHLWSVDQIKEQLGKPIDEGGSGLSVDDVKPLFDAGFKGNVFPSIVENIKKKDGYFAIDQLEHIYNKSGVPELSKICKTVVFWVINQMIFNVPVISFKRKRRFTTIESIEQGSNLDLIQEAGCTMDSLEAQQPEIVNWYGQYAKLLLKGELQQFLKPQDKTVYLNEWTFLFEQAYILSPKRTLKEGNPLVLALKAKPKNEQKIISDLFFEGKKITLQPNLLKHDVYEKRVNPFRWYDEKQEYILAKDIVPFIPDLQVPITHQEKLDQLLQSNKFIALIGPGMIGKTATMIRKLTFSPGILMTGCTQLEVENLKDGIDYATWPIRGDLQNLTIFSKYSKLPQVILTNIIARLVYINWAIKIWNERENKAPFQNSLFAFLAFAQYNGNTKCILDILDSLQEDEFYYRPISELNKVVGSLLSTIKDQTKSNDFYFCLDEANLLAIDNTYLLSPNGSRRDTLTTILSLLKKFDIKVMIAGTHFSSEIVDVIISALSKTELQKDGVSFFFLDLVNRDEFKKIVEKSCNISALEKIMGKKWDLFMDQDISSCLPTRRRVVTMAIELLPSLHFNFKDAFEKAFNMYVDQVSDNIRKRLEKDISDPDWMNYETILQFLVRRKFPQLFSTSTITVNSKLAHKLISSGFSAPIYCDQEYNISFDIKDPATIKIVETILKTKYNPNQEIISDSSMLKKAIILYLNNTIDPSVAWEMIIGFSLVYWQTHNMEMFSNNYLPLEQEPKLITSDEFYLKFHREQWAVNALSKIPEKDCVGDYLYWYCFTNKEYHPLILGLVFKPTKKCHSDYIVTRYNLKRELEFKSFSTKIQVSEELSVLQKEARNGFYSTRPATFYVENYEKKDVVERSKIRWWENFFPIIAQSKCVQVLCHAYCTELKMISDYCEKNLPQATKKLLFPSTAANYSPVNLEVFISSARNILKQKHEKKDSTT